MADKVLIVDDEIDIIETLSVRLKGVGYEVVGSTVGRRAVEMARSINPDVIILDVMMPDMDGLEIKARLNDNPLTASVPVIFLSADINTADKLKALGLGAVDYVTKPFVSDELLARMKAVVDRRRYYEKLSMTDGLTGLYNHVFFKKQLSCFFNIAKRYKKAFSVIVADIDEFKKINDTHGHTAGDCILKEFAGIAARVLRTSDIAARYGGDEFCFLLPETDADKAGTAVKRLKDGVAAANVAVQGTDIKIRFSISAGLASYEDSYKSETDVFDCADKRLYDEKRSRQQGPA